MLPLRVDDGGAEGGRITVECCLLVWVFAIAEVEGFGEVDAKLIAEVTGACAVHPRGDGGVIFSGSAECGGGEIDAEGIGRSAVVLFDLGDDAVVLRS